MALAIWTALAMLAFAGNSILTRMAVGAGTIDAQSFALIRLLSGAFMLALVMLWRKRQWPALRGRGQAVLGLLVYLFGFSAAYVSLSAGTGALILFGMVQVTMFAGALLAGEVVAAKRWAGAGLALAGLVVLLAPKLVLGGLWPLLAMTAAGVGWGIYSLAGRRAGDPLAATAANFVLAVPVAALIWAIWGGGDWQPRGVGLAVLSGAVTSGLGYALWYRVLPQLGASRAAVAQLTVPVLAATAGLALGEPIGLRFAISALLVLGGVALAKPWRCQKARPLRLVSSTPR
jgi:drug/metabolite transporter (DMT)-like permease